MKSEWKLLLKVLVYLVIAALSSSMAIPYLDIDCTGCSIFHFNP